MANIISIESAYGHCFIGSGDEADEYDSLYESCLTCGAMYVLSPVDADSNHGRYHAITGSEPNQCSRDTSHVHGYAGEREDGPNYNCNCLICEH